MVFNISTLVKKDALLKAFVTDLWGKFHQVIFPISELQHLCSIWLPIDGSSFEGINIVNDADARMKWLSDTILLCPEEIQGSEKQEYWIICELLTSEWLPHPHCPRWLLKKMQARLANEWEGWKLYLGAEPEAYLIKDKSQLLTTTGGNTSYCDTKSDITHIVLHITNILQKIGFQIERSHTEVGQEQFEINWKFDTAEKNADQIQFYKLICLKVAKQFWYDVTFLPKPYPNRNGSGMHFNISVLSPEKNLFFNARQEKNHYFSDTALNFLEWILSEVRSLSAVANRAEASYARLVPGFEAPVVVAIGAKNRTVLCRVPSLNDPKKLEKMLRAEFRFPDPLANPYLLCSCFLALWLEGIHTKKKFSGFTEKNLYAMSLDEIYADGFKILPRTLWESYEIFSQNKIYEKYLWVSLCQSYKWLLMEEIWQAQAYANTYSTEKNYLA